MSTLREGGSAAPGVLGQSTLHWAKMEHFTLRDSVNMVQCRGKFLIIDIFVKPNFRVKSMLLIMDISS